MDDCRGRGPGDDDDDDGGKKSLLSEIGSKYEEFCA